MQLQKLHSTHRLVAALVAQGHKIADICAELGLNLETWRQVASCDLFKQEVDKLTSQQIDKMLEAKLQDPALAKLNSLRHKAVDRLGQEIDAYGEELGASSATRIKAATSVLDRIGLGPTPTTKTTQQQHPTIVINISHSKLSAVLEKAEKAGITVDG